MTREAMERLAESEEWQHRRAVAAHPNTPPEVLLRLAHDGKSRKIRATARAQLERRGLDWNVEGEARLEVLRWLAEHKDDGNRQRAAVATDSPSELLAKLAGDEDWGVREAVARNSVTPPQILQRLAHDSDDGARNAARAQLERRGLDWHLEGEARLDLLRWLAGHKDNLNRRRAAEAPDCPPKTLVKMAEDDDWEVREAVASNPNAPSAALEQLSDDEHGAVSAAAREQLEQRKRESACADYEAELEVGGLGYGGGL